MVKELRIYYEGDGALKPGFRIFLREVWDVALARRCSVRLIEVKGRPVRDFHKARRANPEAWNILLLDSEEAITVPLSEFCLRKNLAGLFDSVFWMAQCMESWFLADIECLKNYYDDGFQETAMRGNPQVEQIPKQDVHSRLNVATRNSGKGKYHKTRHAPDLLGRIKPELVKAAAPNCKRLFESLLKNLAEG